MAYTTINKSSEHFDSKIYTGNGSSQTLDMDNLGLLWMKNRTETSNHNLFDVVRGGYYTSAPGPNLRPNGSTEGGGSDITSAYGITFGSSSSTIGSDGGGYNYNQNGKSYVGWQWRANGQGSSNTAGSINTTYTSVNTTSKFSISTYTGNNTSGATVGHGLGAVPKMIIVKRLDSADNWCVYHVNIGNTRRTILNSTGNYSTGTGYWNDTSPTSTVFTIGNSSEVNSSGGKYVAYAFCDVNGFAKFGGYTGDYNANGNFCYLGFKPAFVILKNWSSSGYSWELFDNKRNTTDGVGNVIQKRLLPDSTSADNGSSSTNFIDFLSNGFKIRRAGDSNENNSNYIFMAFAEAPLVGSNNVPCTAR